MDAKKHWQTAQPGSGTAVKADYTIDSNAAAIMQIGEDRTSNRPTAVRRDAPDPGQDHLRLRPRAADLCRRIRPPAVDNGVTGTLKTTLSDDAGARLGHVRPSHSALRLLVRGLRDGGLPDDDPGGAPVAQGPAARRPRGGPPLGDGLDTWMMDGLAFLEEHQGHTITLTAVKSK